MKPRPYSRHIPGACSYEPGWPISHPPSLSFVKMLLIPNVITLRTFITFRSSNVITLRTFIAFRSSNVITLRTFITFRSSNVITLRTFITFRPNHNTCAFYRGTHGIVGWESAARWPGPENVYAISEQTYDFPQPILYPDKVRCVF